MMPLSDLIKNILSLAQYILIIYSTSAVSVYRHSQSFDFSVFVVPTVGRKIVWFTKGDIFSFNSYHNILQAFTVSWRYNRFYFFFPKYNTGMIIINNRFLIGSQAEVWCTTHGTAEDIFLLTILRLFDLWMVLWWQAAEPSPYILVW